ncbi:MAG: T9SS type A sorting domain-containing protein [Chloroherpetonaceae bacterium]|nr:T9SS type A sorting domain-containing protein [Chloroherpetonaceae bacterium]
MKPILNLSRRFALTFVLLTGIFSLQILDAQPIPPFDTTASLYTFNLPMEVYGVTEFKGNLLFSTKTKWLITDRFGKILDSSRSGSFQANLTNSNGRLFAAKTSPLFKGLYELDTATFSIQATLNVKNKNIGVVSVANEKGVLRYIDLSTTPNTSMFLVSSDTISNQYTFEKQFPPYFILTLNLPSVTIEPQEIQTNRYWFASTCYLGSSRKGVVVNIDSSFQRPKRQFIINDVNYETNATPITGITFVPTGDTAAGKTALLVVAQRSGKVKVFDPSQNDFQYDPIQPISPTFNAPINADKGFTPIYTVRNQTYFFVDSIYAELEIKNSQNQSIYKSTKRPKPLGNWDEDTVVFNPITGLPKGEYSLTISIKRDTLQPAISSRSHTFTVEVVGSEKLNRRVGYLAANRVKTKFQNDGLIGGKTYISPLLPSLSWPVEANEYIYDLSLILGTERVFRDTLVLPFVGSSNYTRLRDNKSVPAPQPNPRRVILPLTYQGKDAFDVTDTAVYVTTHQGPRSGVYRIINGNFEGLQPQSTDFNPLSASPALKSDPTTYPASWGGKWKTRRNDGVSDANEETYFVLDDATDGRWFEQYGYLPFNKAGIYGVGFTVSARYLQFTRSDLQDAIVFAYDIKNNTASPMQKVVIGNVVGTAVGRMFNLNTSLYNKTLNLTYSYNPGSEVDASWDKRYPVGYVGLKLLETPNQLGLTSWKFDLSSLPRMGESDNLWEISKPGTFDELIPDPRDGDYTQGTGYFTLNAGTTKRYAYAIVFGENYDKLVANSIAIQSAYDSVMNGNPVDAPLSVQKPKQGVERFEIMQNYPNPFNPATTIQYRVPNRSNIELEVFDVLGRRVAILDQGVKEMGSYSVVFRASGVASGVYFYRLKSSTGFIETKKMILVK